MSLPYAQLGPYQFTVLKAYEARSRDDQYRYPQHDLIEGKPILQWIGDDLVKIRLVIQLHVKFCDPDAEVQALRQAAAQHQALNYILNSGEVVGQFMIQSIKEVTQVTDQNHRTICSTLDLDLLEYSPGDGQAPLTGPGIARTTPPRQAIPARMGPNPVQAAQPNPDRVPPATITRRST